MRILTGLLLLFFIGLVVACTDVKNDTLQDQRQNSLESRAQTFARAEDKFRIPRLENFPMREALVEYTNRQDLVNHPWYIYILGQNGNYIGYFVGKTYPQSTCNFLSSTEEIYIDRSSDGNTGMILTAPSLDGVYYGGAGSQGGGCDYFFFDAGTNAMQVIHHNLLFFVSDAPLRLDVQPIKVATP